MPEYDYMQGCDFFIFYEQVQNVKNAFLKGNTEFSRLVSTQDIIAKEITSEKELTAFFIDNGDCKTDANGNCPKVIFNEQTGGTTKNFTSITFEHQSYLAGIKNFTLSPTKVLGVTGASGEKEKTFSLIYVSKIKADYDKYNLVASTSYTADQYVETTVIHELGHQRAALTHLCYDSNRNMRNINNHSNYACVMINSLPKSLCTNNNGVKYDAMLGYSSTTVTVPQFCDKCSNNLKNVDWSVQ